MPYKSGFSGEDSYLEDSYDDQPTGGADYAPDDREPDDYQDYADEMSDGFGNRYRHSNSEMLQY